VVIATRRSRRVRFLAPRHPAVVSRLLDLFARAVFLEGFSLHARVRIHERDREGLERLCRETLGFSFR
jgi:hypothetical protein